MIAYFDCFSGISGDMTLGALVDAGISLEELKKKLAGLSLKGYTLSVKKVKRAEFRATKVDIAVEGKAGNNELRRWKDIKTVIESSKLRKDIKEKGLFVFKRLFEAEARVHGSRYDRVHLHELAAIDCIIDIIGTLIGLEILGVDLVYSSPVNIGNGKVKTHHGLLPVPAPATVELLKNKPVYSSDTEFELATPTGAALVSSLASGFGPMPYMKLKMTGIGAGNRNFKERPNILRIFIGEKYQSAESGDNVITVIETNIDDMSPQVYEYVVDRLFKAGALDVFLTQIIMKKGRPGILLTVLCNENIRKALIDIILTETTSIGLRFYLAKREVLKRHTQSIHSRYGKVNMKIAQLGNKKSRTSVEYEDCKKIARKFNIPLIEVMDMIYPRRFRQKGDS